MDLDEFQDEIGGISRYQVIVIIISCLVALAQSMTSQGAIFLNAVPNHRCASSLLKDFGNCNFSEETIINATIPIDGEEFSSCAKYDYNVSRSCLEECSFSCVSSDNVKTTFCNEGYVYDYGVYGKTVASEFDLVCSRRYLDTIAQTLFFAGFFLGSAVVGPLSDWFGRRKAIVILGFFMVIFSTASAHSPSYVCYAILRIFVGGSNISLYISMFVYATEIANTKWRTEAGIFAYLTSAFAHTLFPAFAYICKDWRKLQYVLALSPVPFLLVFFFLPESPRWLLATRKIKEAKKVVCRYAQSKGKTLTDETWNLIVQSEAKKTSEEKLKSDSSVPKIRVWDLFRRPLMRIICLNVIFSWFALSMVFYGLALNGGNLAGDPYLNVTVNSLVEIFAALFVYFAYRFGRRRILSASCMISGLFCLFSLLCNKLSFGRTTLFTVSTAFAVTGKFFATLAFDIAYMATAELFPTISRSTGLSLGSMAARVGAMLSPLVLEIQRSVPWFSQTVFGVLSIVCGLTSLIYPETSTTDLITSLDAAENYYRKSMSIPEFFKKKKNSKTAQEMNDVESEKNTLVA